MEMGSGEWESGNVESLKMWVRVTINLIELRNIIL
jgi:hypothetical protein